MNQHASKNRNASKILRLARRRLVVRVRSVALASAMALGAVSPALMAQTIITPLTGAGQPVTVVSTQGNQTVVSTQTLRDGNAFSTYSAFQVGQGDVTRMAVPTGANWWVNIVRDARVRVDGRLESRLTDGSIGGNILFVDSHGFAVGPNGQVDVGRLSFAAPSTTFVDGLLAGGGVLSGATVGTLLGGAFERSATGEVDIQGQVSAKDGVSLMAGQGGASAVGVNLSGQVVVQGRVAGSAVNLGDLKSLAPLQDLDGVIDITTPGSIRLDGTLISDSSLWRGAGAVRVVAGQDMTLGSQARVSASGTAGTGAAGGQVTLYAQRDIANAPGAALRAHGDGGGAGGAIEYSGARQLLLDNMTLDAGSSAGHGGSVYLDPTDATINQTDSNLITGGTDFNVAADQSITVTAGTVINTRQVASGADATDAHVASTGNSGNISLTAPCITVAAGSVLDASVVNQGGSTYSAGDVTLTASSSSTWSTLVSVSDANATIDVAGTVKGRDITMQASVESTAKFGGSAGSIQQTAIDLALSKLGSPLALSLSYVQATGDATITVRDTAVLHADQDLALTAMADRSAGADLATSGSSSVNLSAGFARVAGTTKVDIQSGAQLQAERNIDLLAASKTGIGMTSAAAGETNADTGAANVASVVFAGSMSEVTTAVNVGVNAKLTSGADTVLQAFQSGNYSTTAEVTVYGGGTAGVVGALSLQNSTTATTVDGQISAGGNVQLMAMDASAKNEISATAVNASEAPPSLGLPSTLVLSDQQAQDKLTAGFLALAVKVAEESESASSGGASAQSKPPALRMAGALTWSESHHTTTASLGDGASIQAGGNAVVDAQTLAGRLKSAALSEATSETQGADGSKMALSAAFNFSDHNYTTRADIGVGALVSGDHVAVHAATDIPQFYTAGLPTQWDNFFAVYANLMGGTDPLYDGFNSRVGAASSATNLALAGAVNLSYLNNDTRAWIDQGASVTSTSLTDAAWSYGVREVPFASDIVTMVTGPDAYTLDKKLGVLGDFVTTTRLAPDGSKLDEINFTHTYDAATVVRAENHVQTLHLAGGSGPEAGGSGGAVGGTFSMVDRSNTAIAGIADAAVIQTRRLDVAARTEDWLLAISPTAGSGEGVAANGMVSYNTLSDTTRASISREALVTAPKVSVNADLGLWVLAVTGAVTQSDNSGVGIGVAMNEMTGDTTAYVGDNDADARARAANTAEGAVGAIKTSDLAVQARSDGMVAAVGVAGAAAGDGTKPPGSGLSEKADGLTAGSTAKTGDSGTASLSGATDGMQSQGAGGGGTGDAGASSPPKFSIAGAGAVVTNFSNLDTTALVDGALVQGIDSGVSRLGVQALSDLTQVSVAGGGALTMANNSSTSFSSAIAGAAAIQDSGDDTTARVVDSTVTDLADAAGSLNVAALKSGERTAVATGISANLSKGSSNDLSVAGSLSLTRVSDHTAAGIDNSTITGYVATPAAASANVAAYDRSHIGAGGGALSLSTGKGSAGIGAAISLVDLQGSTSAQVNGGSLTQLHDLTVAALSSQKVVGVGAVAGVQTSSDSLGQLMGAFVFNEVGNLVSAGITGAAQVNLTGDLTLQAGGAPADGALDALLGNVRASTLTDYDMTSSGNGYSADMVAAAAGESIVGVAGTLAVSLGGNASSVGLSYVQNNIQSTYSAELDGQVTAGGLVAVNAASRANIVGVSAGLGATKGKFAGMGSATVNLIGQRTQARVTGGSVTAGGLALDSGTTGNIFGFAGNVSLAVGSGSGVAAGAAVAYNQTGTRTYTVAPSSYVVGDVTYTDAGGTLTTRAAGNEASVSNATVNVSAGLVDVHARNTSDTRAVAAAGAASTGNVAFAGTATWNEMGDVTSALIDASTVTADRVTVDAGEASAGRTASIESLAGGLSASKGYSGALAFGFNTIDSVRSARVTRSTLVVGSSVDVEAAAQGSIQTISATLAGGKDYAAAGSSSVNWLNADVLAEYDADSDGVAGGSVNSLQGTATSLTVRATGSAQIKSLAGSVAGAGTGAIGGSVAVNNMGQGADQFRVRALLSNIDVQAPVAVTVDAALLGSIGSVAASGGGAGTAAINGSVTTNALDATVLAQASGVNQTGSVGAFKVTADNAASISSLAGTIGGAGTAAVGAAVSVNDIGGDVTARLATGTLRAAGAVTVQAETTGTIQSIAAGMAGGGTVGAAGSNTTNGITSTVQAQLEAVDMAVNADTVTVQARDASTIESLAGTVAGGGTAGGGAALALNFLGRTATDQAGSKVVSAEVLDSRVRSTGAVLVDAYSTSTIRSVGVAAGASGTVALTGSNATNLLEDDISAIWRGSDLIRTGANTLTVIASDNAQIDSLAGNLSGSGGVAVGAALAVNRIGTATNASLTGVSTADYLAGNGHFTVWGNDVVVAADSDAQINTLAVGMSAAATAGVQGSVAVSVINSRTQAVLGASDEVVNVIADDSVGVTANSRDRIKALAGAVGFGATGVGAAGGVLTNIVTSTTTAGVAGNDSHVTALAQGNGLTVKTDSLASSPDLMDISAMADSVLDGASYGTRTVKGLAVQATSIEQIGALTAVASGAIPTGGASVGVGASVNVDQIGGSTRAYIDGARFINADPALAGTAAQTVDVMAANHAMIASSTAALAVGDVGVSGAVGTEMIDRSTRAEVLNSAVVQAAGPVSVKALSTNTVAQIAAGGAGGTYAGVAGSGDVALIEGETVAQVDSSTIEAGSVSVLADGSNYSNLIVGSLGASGVAGVGLSFTVNVSGSTVRSLVTDSLIRADDAVTVHADNTTKELAVAATAGGGGVAGVAIGAAVTVLQGQTEANIGGTSVVERRTRATGTVASLNDAELKVWLDGNDGTVTANEQGATHFVLMTPATTVNGETVPAAPTSLVGGGVLKISDGTREVTATLNADGSYSADLSSLGDGQLSAVVYTAATNGVPDAGSPSSRLVFTKAAGVGSLSVAANEHVDISHNAGGIGAAGVAGVGSAANVVVGRSTVLANASGSTLTVGGELAVVAARDAKVDMITATAGGGGVVGVSGAVGVLLFGSAPDSNATSELNDGSGSSLARVSAATQSSKADGTGSALGADEQSSLNAGASYDTQAAFTGATGKHSTSATVTATSVQAGSVRVSGTDSTQVSNNAGAIAAGGAAGVSAGVAVTILGGANNASVSATTLDTQGAISVDAGTRAPTTGGTSVQSRAIAGAGGFVGVGAAVSVARNQTANTAALGGQVTAGGAVNVSALDQASMSSEAFGATAGAISVGAVVATADQSGSVKTQAAGHLSGQGLVLGAERQASVDAKAVGGSAGVVAGSGAAATASDSGTVQVDLASGLALDAGTGDLRIAASSNPHANSDAVGVAVGAGGAVGISIAQSTIDSAVSVNSLGTLTLSGQSVRVSAVLGAGDAVLDSAASAGAGGLLIGGTGASATARNSGSARVNLVQPTGVLTTGDAAFTATDAMAVTSNAVGVGVGFVGVGVAESTALSNTTVNASVSDLVGSVGGSLQVSAGGNESIGSDATAGSGGVVSGAGANSAVIHTLTVNAQLGGDLVVGGMTMVDATRTVRYDSHSTAANASAVGASGAVTNATLSGSATAALLDGAALDGNSLRVLATNDLARNDLGRQSAEGGGGGVISGAGADVVTVLGGTANAIIGDGVDVTLENLLELRAYNELHGSALGRMDVGGAIPIALVETSITGNADANASVGNNSRLTSYGESHVDALSYVDLEANSISKTYGLAAAAQGNAYATANVNNRVDLGVGTLLRSASDVSLLAGQDRDFNRNLSFVTARTDLFNHSAIPVSINPDADATLNLNNAVTVNADAVRSGGTIRVGGVQGTLSVSGNGNVSDWTRDLGELVGISSTYGKSIKNLTNTALLNGALEAGYGNKQRLVIGSDGSILSSVGDVRYTITNEDLSASASDYVNRLYDQLARYGDVPEVRAFVEAELSFYFSTLLKEGLAQTVTLDNGTTMVVPLTAVAANFLNIKDLRAGSGNIELFGDNVTGSASLTARADSEIYIENNSPLNLRVYNMTVDANGGFAKYNGTYLTSAADIGTLNTSDKSTGLSVDSIDTRGGGAAQQLPTLTVKNTYVPLGSSNTAVVVTAPDGTSANLQQDQMRAPEIRVDGTLYNKLGTVTLSNTAGSISVYAEDPSYTPRLDGKEISVTAGKNFNLSSPTISQSVGGSPESLYAVAYSSDQQKILDNLGVAACGSARPGDAAATSYNANCVVNGAGGVYASGAIFIGARYLNINGTVQSGQPDYSVVLSSSTVGVAIDKWQSQWDANRGLYLSQGKSSLIQVTGPLPTDSEAEINKQFANGTITAAQRTSALDAMAARRLQPVVYYDADTKRLKVAPTNVTGGLVELIGTIINTGGGVVKALDGYAHINIDNQTSYGLDLLGLNTGGEAGVVRITDMGKPVLSSDGSVSDYQTTTYQRDADGVFRATVTSGRGIGATVLGTTNSSLATPSGSVKAKFTYNPVADSTYSWSAGYDFTTENRYWYQSSSWLGFIPGGSVNWNSVNTYVKTAYALPSDVFVSTTLPVGGGTFSLQSQRFTTATETPIYYRSWSKCGFLCIKKTNYVDYRTQTGYKDVFTQRVAADHPIDIQLVGYDSGQLNITSVGDIRLGGDIVNNSGAVSLTSTQGSISQLNTGATVNGVDLSFHANSGIGSEAAPVNLITGSGSFTAVSNSGDVAFHGNSGALRINQVSTTGNVWLDGDGSIFGLDPNAVHVSGNRIYLSAPSGGIGEFNADGSVKATLNIQSADSTYGGMSASARNGIAIKQPTGNLWVNQVISGGDVYLESGGDLIDNNRNETRDERTTAQLLALWDQAALQGTSAEASRQLTITTTRAQYQRYWSLRGVSNVKTDASGNVTQYESAAIDPATYQYHFSDEERQSYLSAGISEAQLASIEAARTQEVLQLNAQFGDTAYQTGNDQIIAAINAANLSNGKAEVGALAVWSDTELKSPLPAAVFSKSSTTTQTRIEAPNVVGNHVVLRPGGKVGRDDGSITIPLLQAQRLADGLPAELSTDEKLAIMTAESTDMTLDRDTWTLTVQKKDNFNVLSNRLNVAANGFIYLGADETAAFPTGGTINLENVVGTGEVRIHAMDSILNAAGAGVTAIKGQDAILEAAQGSIGTALNPVQIQLSNDASGTLVARGSSGIWIHEIGDMRAADIYTPGLASLSATGAIIDARPVINYPNPGDRTVRSIEAETLTLDAQHGAIGSDANPMVVKVGAGGVNATTPRGYSVYLDAASGSSLTLNVIDSGLDVRALSPYGGLYNLGTVNALGSIDVQAGGDVTNVAYTAGSTIVIGTSGGISGDKVKAVGTVTLTAGDGVDFNSLQTSRSASVTAGAASNVNLASAGGDLSLVSSAGGFSGIAWTAGGSLWARAGGDAGDIAVTSVAATRGNVDIEGGNAMQLDVASAQGDVKLKAGSDMTLINISSRNGLLSLTAGDGLSLSSGSSRGAVTLDAGSGIDALSLSSASGLVKVASSTGDVGVQSISAKSGLDLSATTGNVNLGDLRTASGGLTLTSGAAMQVRSATVPGNIVATAGTSANFGTLTSSSGDVNLTANLGALYVAKLNVKNDVFADAKSGDLSLGAFTASSATLHAGNNVLVGGPLATRGDMVISSAGNADLGQLTSTGGAVSVGAGGTLAVASAKAAKTVTLSGGLGVSADTLASSSAGIDVRSTSGKVTVSKALARAALVADALNGDLEVGAFTAGSVDLQASGLLQVVTTGVTTGGMVIAGDGDVRLTSLNARGGIKADAGGTLTVSNAQASGTLDLSAGTGLVAGTLLSSSANILVDTAAGALDVSSATARTQLAADAKAGDLTLGKFAAASADLHAHDNLRISGTGATSGDMVISSDADAQLASLSSSSGAVTVNSGGALEVTTVKAGNAVSLSGQAGVSAAALSSSRSDVNVASALGSVLVKSASAKTSFKADSGGDLTVGSFTVSAGGANLEAAGATTLNKGVAGANIAVISAGNADLGTLSTQSGSISATSSGGGLTFGTLLARTGITLDAAQAWRSGSAISGTSLLVSAGGVNLSASAGDLSIGSLSATAPSTLETLHGSIYVGRITRLMPYQLTVAINDGVKQLPRGF